MNRKAICLAVAIMVLSASQVFAQVLFTGKTSGENNGSVYVFGTVASIDGVTSANNWVGLVLGATDKVDVVLGYGDMTTLGEHFPYVAFGGVVGLPTQKLGFDSMVYQLFSLPHANRSDSSTLFGNSVVIISKDIIVNGYTLTPYTGYNCNYAIGPKDRLMTFSETVHQLPLGVFMPVISRWGRYSWGFTTEYDYGSMKSFGVALNYSFQYR